jgi:hypothetical protein
MLYFDIADFYRHHPGKKNLKTETFPQRRTDFLTRLSVTNGKLDASQASIVPSMHFSLCPRQKREFQ